MVVLQELLVLPLQVSFEDDPPYVERVVFVSESITPGEGAVSAHRCDQFILVNKPGCEDRSATRDVTGDSSFASAIACSGGRRNRPSKIST